MHTGLLLSAGVDEPDANHLPDRLVLPSGLCGAYFLLMRRVPNYGDAVSAVVLGLSVGNGVCVSRRNTVACEVRVELRLRVQYCVPVRLCMQDALSNGDCVSLILVRSFTDALSQRFPNCFYAAVFFNGTDAVCIIDSFSDCDCRVDCNDD